MQGTPREGAPEALRGVDACKSETLERVFAAVERATTYQTDLVDEGLRLVLGLFRMLRSDFFVTHEHDEGDTSEGLLSTEDEEDHEPSCHEGHHPFFSACLSAIWVQTLLEGLPKRDHFGQLTHETSHFKLHQLSDS